MRRIQTQFLLVALALVIASRVEAAETVCTGTLTGTFDSVVVRSGATCNLINSTVNGNVKAEQGSRLIMVNNVVRGNVHGDKANAVHVVLSTIGGNIDITEAGDPQLVSALVRSCVVTGNIHIVKGRYPQGDWVVEDNEVLKGNVKIEDNGTTFMSKVLDNNGLQNLQVFKNVGSAAKLVVFNTGGQNFDCKDNETPFTGGPNSGGTMKGQCF